MALDGLLKELMDGMSPFAFVIFHWKPTFPPPLQGHNILGVILKTESSPEHRAAILILSLPASATVREEVLFFVNDPASGVPLLAQDETRQGESRNGDIGGIA